MAERPLLEELMDALRCLPGVGPKSAQRMALHLLEMDRDGGQRLAVALARALAEIDRCRRCRGLSERPLCAICGNPKRDAGLLCVVEQPGDQVILEHAADYSGLYFVLGGHLSPLDGIGPREIGLDYLDERLARESLRELILAVHPTVEGDATAHFIREMAEPRGIRVTRLAQGVPLGGELEFVDSGTLAHAFRSRLEV